MGGLGPILVLFVTRVFSRPPTLFGTFHFGRPTDEATERPTTESDFPCRNSSDPFSVQSDRVTVDRHTAGLQKYEAARRVSVMKLELICFKSV